MLNRHLKTKTKSGANLAVSLCLALAGFLAFSAPANADTKALYTGEVQQVQKKATHRDPESFRYNGPLPKKLKVSFADLAGRAISLEDSYGNGVFELKPDGNFSFSDDGGTKGISGYWWADLTGRFCVTSPEAWPSGACYTLYGASLESLKGGVQHYFADRFYPMALVR